MGEASVTILIAGAGIAGLTAALAFARRGFEVRLFERAPELFEIGAGLQLSPNATRLLDGLGLGEAQRAVSTRPEAVVLRRADNLREIARLPLGDAGRMRWGGDYLVAHRADLQSVLLEAVRAEPKIQLELGRRVEAAEPGESGARLRLRGVGGVETVHGRLLVGADGVWSSLRGGMMEEVSCRDTGLLAWRAVVARELADGWLAAAPTKSPEVTAFLHPRFHLVAYPLRGGRDVNLVAVTRHRAGSVESVEHGWAEEGPAARLAATMGDAAPELTEFVSQAGSWSTWPLFEVPADTAWTKADWLVLIGDAAHAMTPHAAQGAAMAIEDAVVLADAVAARPSDMAGALAAYEAARRPRVDRVRRRGRFNRFVWHAWGPFALGRDAVLAMRPAGRVAADFDWLYGWKPGEGA